MSRYQRLQRRRYGICGLLAIAAVAAFILDLSTGPSDVSVIDVLRALLSGSGAREDGFIVWQLRLPQAVLAALTGAALGLAGLEMQTILRNPLADPFTLGVSAAAALGAALAIVLGIGIPGVHEAWIVAGNAFVFATGSLLVLLFLVKTGIASAERLILFGIAMGFTFGALLSLLQFVASPDALQQLVFWSMGSLVRANWTVISVLGAALAIVAPLSYRSRWRLTVIAFGEEHARSLGINVARLRLAALVRISLLAALSVAFAGIIGFVGLTGPHIARLIVGDDHRFLMPASALTSMIVMSAAAAASKAVMPGVIVPIGIVTALIGLPVFFALLVLRGGAP
ncbi:iron ABC transporter permease [Shinella zoogloeoides]|uniref:FecCD family ABC transporter permease n=1 Tax=Shinella zoogloeoides TaxID=352475 RepID=UPI0028B1E4DA|nr:iron ABC transporter permease [Shinella zoogloeoides]